MIFDAMRGGQRTDRPRRGGQAALRLILANVTALVPRWQQVMALQADIVLMTEVRITREEQRWLTQAAHGRGWSAVWSQPVQNIEHRQGGGMCGRSGGVGILCDKHWHADKLEGRIEFEAGATNHLVVRMHTNLSQDTFDLVIYYGHPATKARTKRDLSRIAEYAYSSPYPTIVAGDVNMGDEEELHMWDLTDVGEVYARTRHVTPTPTYDGQGEPTRIDRVWVPFSWYERLLSYDVTEALALPGHKEVCLALSIEARPYLTRPVHPPLKPPQRDKTQTDELVRAACNSWDMKFSEGVTSTEEAYRWWSTTWEAFLSEDPSPVLRRHTVPKPRPQMQRAAHPSPPLCQDCGYEGNPGH